MILTMAALDTPRSRNRRISSSLPSSRETPSEPFGRPSFLPEDLVVRHVIIFGHGHGLQRAIIDESQHRKPERLIMAQH